MIYSRSAEYAIRAFVHLAAVPEGKFAMAKNIAEQSEIPAHFLAKILQQLARKGFLRSSKGPTGGFCLRRPATEISLIEVVESVDGLSDYERCISGMANCADDTACGLHDTWKGLRGSIMGYLEKTTIADVADAQEQKRRALEKNSTKKNRRPAKRA
jgi:Rrf2 family protein